MSRVFLLLVCSLFSCGGNLQTGPGSSGYTNSVTLPEMSKVDSAVFQDQIDPSRMLFLSNVRSVDALCKNPTLIYVHPLLVSLNVVCKLTNDGEKIVYMGELKTSKSYFDFQFFGYDHENIFFLANGREFPDGVFGYVDVKRVSRTGFEQDIRELLREVPGFSGGMVHDQRHGVFIYTSTTDLGVNKLYEIKSEKLKDLMTSNQSMLFQDIVTSDFIEFEGLSLSLKVNDKKEYLFDNGEYESFVIINSKKHIIQIPKGCRLIGTQESYWVFSCADSRIVKYSTKKFFNDG